MIGDWSTLQVASGSAMFAPFAILLLQVVLFLAAWTVLAVVVVREVLAFKDGPSQAQSAHGRSAAGRPAASLKQNAVGAAAPPNAADAGADEPAPFDIDAAIFELQPDPDEARPEEEEALPAPTIVEEETVFVYGDPLAGDLPEIFSYDTDLMRDVQDMREKARKQAQTNQQKKK